MSEREIDVFEINPADSALIKKGSIQDLMNEEQQILHSLGKAKSNYFNGSLIVLNRQLNKIRQELEEHNKGIGDRSKDAELPSCGTAGMLDPFTLTSKKKNR